MITSDYGGITVITQRNCHELRIVTQSNIYCIQYIPIDRLKREILLALVRGTLWPEDASRKEELLCKYEKFILPEEVQT